MSGIRILVNVFVCIILPLPGNSDRLLSVRLQQSQEQRYPVTQVHVRSFRVSVIHKTLTWTTGSLTCVRDQSYACVYTRGLGTATTSQHNVFDSKQLFFLFKLLCSWRGSNLGSLDLESDATPIEPPRHPKMGKSIVLNLFLT